ncbi:MAG: T9SS type A sorting domain-containing protein [Bacteroidetes bacterium]|nr:T9SS type A sorting domain-containing protein [Bacteroidota bacterium]
MNNDATKFTIRPISTNELPPNGTYVWDLPSAWNVTFNGTSFTLNSTTSLESQRISVSYVLDGNVVERTSKVVHFSNQENSNKNSTLSVISEKKLTIIYPNPATNFVTINLPNIVNNAKVEIINLEGKVIFSKSNITGCTTLNTESYCNGIYIVKVSSAELNEVTKLRIKH